MQPTFTKRISGAIISGSLVLTSLLHLAGCSGLLPKRQQLEPVYELTQWSLQGKLGASTPSGGGSGLLTWEESKDRYHLWVSGPLGRGSTEIEGNVAGVTLTTGGERFHNKTPEQLLQTHLGWNFPVNRLRFWVKGLPDPNQGYQWHRNEQGALTGFTQAGWRVDLSHYAPVAGYLLPYKITLSRPDWRFTLIVKKWQVP